MMKNIFFWPKKWLRGVQRWLFESTVSSDRKECMVAENKEPVTIYFMTPAEESRHLRLYSLHRNYSEHENHLINHRLSWNLTIQGFLFAAYALSFHKAADLWLNVSKISLLCADQEQSMFEFVHLKSGIMDIYVFLIPVAVVGAIVSFLSHYNIVPAYRALDEIRKKWCDTYPEYKESPGKPNTHGSNPLNLPGISGGGVSLRVGNARIYQWPKSLLVVFIYAWLFLLVFDVWIIRNLMVSALDDCVQKEGKPHRASDTSSTGALPARIQRTRSPQPRA
jgi:hypothetical protein